MTVRTSLNDWAGQSSRSQVASRDDFDDAIEWSTSMLLKLSRKAISTIQVTRSGCVRGPARTTGNFRGRTHPLTG